MKSNQARVVVSGVHGHILFQSHGVFKMEHDMIYPKTEDKSHSRGSDRGTTCMFRYSDLHGQSLWIHCHLLRFGTTGPDPGAYML